MNDKEIREMGEEFDRKIELAEEFDPDTARIYEDAKIGAMFAARMGADRKALNASWDRIAIGLNVTIAVIILVMTFFLIAAILS